MGDELLSEDKVVKDLLDGEALPVVTEFVGVEGFTMGGGSIDGDVYKVVVDSLDGLGFVVIVDSFDGEAVPVVTESMGGEGFTVSEGSIDGDVYKVAIDSLDGVTFTVVANSFDGEVLLVVIEFVNGDALAVVPDSFVGEVAILDANNNEVEQTNIEVEDVYNGGVEMFDLNLKLEEYYENSNDFIGVVDFI